MDSCLECICSGWDQSVRLVYILGQDIDWLFPLMLENILGNHYCCLLILPELPDILVCQERISFYQDHSVLVVDMMEAVEVEEDMICLLQLLVDMVV